MASVGISAAVYSYNLSALPSPIILAVYTLVVSPYCLVRILPPTLYSERVVGGAILYIQNIGVASSVVSPLGLSNLAPHYPILILGNSGLGHTLELVKVLKA